MNEHIERIFTEANRRFYSGIPTEEMGSAQVDEIELRSFLRTALTSAYNAGLERAYLLAMKTTCNENHIHEISCNFIPTNSLLAAIEKEKIESSPEL